MPVQFPVKNQQNFHRPVQEYDPIIHEHNPVRANDPVRLDDAYIVLFEIHDKPNWQGNPVQSTGQQPAVL